MPTYSEKSLTVMPDKQLEQRISKQIEGFPLLLYMKGSPDFPQCGFSAQVVAALRQCGKRFAYVDILQDPDLRQGLKEFSNWPTFPQLYVRGELVGGADIVTQMARSGELLELVQDLD